jgi:hypothetical protein
METEGLITFYKWTNGEEISRRKLKIHWRIYFREADIERWICFHQAFLLFWSVYISSSHKFGGSWIGLVWTILFKIFLYVRNTSINFIWKQLRI